MNINFESIRLFELFNIISGDYHATKDLDPGNIPLISCKDSNNGFLGYFDIPKNKQYKKAITVAYNGRPLSAKYHPYTFGAKDDVAILIPRIEMSEKALIFIAAELTRLMWRYSYGRKCYREKMKRVEILAPLIKTKDTIRMDEELISQLFPNEFKSYFPEKELIQGTLKSSLDWKQMDILSLFEIIRGDFHSLSALDPGLYPTVSRISTNNGIVGYFDKPANARIYKRGTITVSTVSGDAFLQLEDFMATDNVIICNPRSGYRLSTLLFITLMLNYQKWRYSYGRQCYKDKFSKVKIYVPMMEDGSIDEDAIENIVKDFPYFTLIKNKVNHR